MGKAAQHGIMPQALKMRCPNRVLSFLLVSALLTGGSSLSTQAKGYSSGGGRSYSSHSSSSGSSHSFSSGSGKSFSSGSSHSSSSGSSRSSSSSSGGSSGSSRSSSGSSGSSKNFGSGGGKSYSSGSSWSGNDRHGYSSGKSYSSGNSASKLQSPKAKSLDSGSQSTSSGSGFSFDTAAARARKEEASKQQFTTFKDSQAPRAQSDSANAAAPRDYSSPVSSGGSYQAKPPPIASRRDYYYPTTVIIQSRPRRIYDVFSPYSYRPWVVYNDPYSSLFWWWLLDRSIDDQAWWAYHHRYDMDPARYQALLNNNQQLEARVAQLEAQQAPRDQTYTPTGLDRDLMYSDQYVNRTYANRPTTSGTVAFWIFAVPAAAGGCIFFIWLIWFKRWQTN